MNLSDGQKKAVGMFAILLALLTIGLTIRSIVANDNNEVLENNSQNNAINETSGESVNTDIEYSSSNYRISINDIEDVLKYDINEEIALLLNAEVFNEELTGFLREKNLLQEGSSEEHGIGIYTVTSSNYLTHDLKNDVYIFDLSVNNQEETIVTVSVTKSGSYSFDAV